MEPKPPAPHPDSARQRAFDRIHDELRRTIPEDRILSEELIRDRRAEAEKENQE